MTEINVKPKQKLNIIILAPLIICAGLLCSLPFLGATGWWDLLISLALLLLPAAAAWKFPRVTPVAAAVIITAVSYVSIGLLAESGFTWGSHTSPLLHVYGALWVLSVFLLLYALIGRVTPAAIILALVVLVFGVGNAVTVQFRGRLLLAGDIAALQTAINVAGNFSLSVTAAFVIGALLPVSGCVLAYGLARRAGLEPNGRIRLAFRGGALILCAAWLLTVSFVNIYEMATIRVTWNENDFEESQVLYFVKSVEQMRVEKPDGYSDSSLDEIEDGAVNAFANTGVNPHVIVIMDEAFSDIGMIGDVETNVEVTPFIDSLKENTIRGWVYSSVFGGSTANSEFELLTGSTMAFVPSGVSPYQQYIKYNKDTLVSVLEQQGYSSMALHPYDASGWNRVSVYDCFGFDEVHFKEDFQDREYLRNYITDECNFRNLIRWFEGRDEGEKMFMFNITMQNHGSYKYQPFASTVTINGHEGEFPWAEQYLTLVNKTDAAVEELIGYFEALDEPVVVLFFGDHQPALEAEFYDMAYGKPTAELSLEELQRKQLTPFFIWANYDIPESEGIYTSINYLAPMLLSAAGLETSDFQAFLSDLQKEWPVINTLGFMNAEGEFLPAEDDAVLESETIGQYRQLQYNYLFDTSGYRGQFFGLNP